jgi:putative RecB family exonuclease
LALYQLGLIEEFGTDQPMRLVWHYLARGQTRTSTRTPAQLDELRDQTMSLIDQIEATSEFPPRKGNLCNWCEYKGICPAFGGEPPRAEQPKQKLETRAGIEPPAPLAEGS